ncbi:hypothetical protein C8Q76DRAFT_858930 [Earliella scabrosa]|nr:hypothetical protein C8Q76DRAFT_858930 [Earliella scabrosa]
MSFGGLDGAFAQLAQLRVSVYANVASLALLLYDWQLTFGDEVNMVWKSKAKLSKALFLWIRYFCIASHIFGTVVYVIEKPLPAVCSVATRLQIASPNAIWWSVEFVFALRVWILYRRSRKLLVFLAFMYLTSIIVSIIILIKALVRVIPVSIPDGLGVSGCFSIVSERVYEPIILGVITTSTLCILTVFRTLQARRELTSSPIMTLFLRDGLLYYFSVFAVFLINLMLFRFGNTTSKNLFAGFLDVTPSLASIPCMFGTRVLINILSLVREKFGDHGTTAAGPLSDPQFVRRGTSALVGGSMYPGVPSTQSATDTASSGTVMTDSGFGTGSSGSSSSGATLSMSAGIEEVLRAGDDVEKALGSNSLIS